MTPTGKIDKNKVYALAVSGGVDSMVMLDTFITYQKKFGCRIFVVTVEHGIRGEQSRKDAAFVKEYCDAQGVECRIFEVDTPTYKAKTKQTTEQAARELRYGVFDGVLTRGEADYIVLAHHANDQAETVMMRILRGTGIKGLRGIVDREGYLHPFLSYTRANMLEIAAERNLPFVEDETNNDETYTRNFLRNTLFPLLQTRFPAAIKSINRLAEVSAEMEELIDEQFVRAEKKDNEIILPIDVFKMQGALVRASIMDAFNQLSVTQNVEKRHIDQLKKLSEKPNSTTLDMPYGIRATKNNDYISFYSVTEWRAFEKPFAVSRKYTYATRTVSFVKTDKIEKGCFDLDKIPYGAVVRTREEGDVFKRYGGGTKSLGDYLTDIKLHKPQRDELLVVAVGSEVLLVCGVESADKVKVDDTTKNIYRVDISDKE